MASTFYLQVEGVNFGAVIEDTADLTTARGGSLVLRDAVIEAAGKANTFAKAGKFGCEIVTSGASSAVLRLTCTRGQAEELARSVRRWLAGQDLTIGERKGALGCAEHATFAVVLIEEAAKGGAPSFLASKEKLLAAIRLDQLAGPTVQAPAVSSGISVRDKVRRVCQVDLMRPAVIAQRMKGDMLAVSASVAARRDYGRGRKQDFYVQELSRHGLPTDIGGRSLQDKVFALHFASIAGLGETVGADERAAGKLALLYFDGNGFGTRQYDFIERAGAAAAKCGASVAEAEVKAQREYDACLQRLRAELLRRVLQTLADNGGLVTPWLPEAREREALGGGFVQDKVFAIETLLWGGDELMWVLPARLGWKVARVVLETMEEKDAKTGAPVWSLPGETEPLTSAFGLVFCAHNAPIARLQPDCKAIAEIAKGDRKRNRLCYHVLESFDFLGRDAKKIKELRCAKEMPLPMHVLSGRTVAAVERAAGILASTFPRRRIRRLAQLLVREGPAGAEFQKAQKQIENDPQLGDDWKAIAPAIIALGRQPNYSPEVGEHWKDGAYLIWLHLEELWDYLPETATAAQTATQDVRETA